MEKTGTLLDQLNKLFYDYVENTLKPNDSDELLQESISDLAAFTGSVLAYLNNYICCENHRKQLFTDFVNNIKLSLNHSNLLYDFEEGEVH